MPTMPVESVNTTNLDAGSDNPDSARVDLLDLTNKFNQLKDCYAVANGFCDLDADGKVPDYRLPPEGILSNLLTVDGAGCGLDADLLDGLQATAFILTDGTRDLSTTQATGWIVQRRTTSNNARARGLTIQQVNTPGATAAGYGTEIRFQLNNAAGTFKDAGYIAYDWTTASDANEDSDLIFGIKSNGALIEGLRLKDTKQLEWAEISTPGGTPAAGKRWVYLTSSGLAMKDSGGTETLFAAATGSDHNLLSNLTAGDVHTQYFRTDGSRVLTGNFQLGAHSILTTDLGADPSPPTAGQVLVYTKGEQLYYQQSDGTVVGPLLTGGVTVHADLTGLTVDDHPQYLLRQPASDVVLNDSGGDFDWRIEAVGLPNFFRIDAGTGVLGVNTIGGLVTALGRVQVTATTGTAIRAAATSGAVFDGAAASGTVFNGNILSGAGRVAYFTRTANATPTEAALHVADADTTNGFRTLYVTQAASGAQVARFDTAVGEVVTLNAGELTVNEGGGNYDVRFEGDTKSQLFFLDASADVVSINGALTQARFNVTGEGMDGIYGVSDTSDRAGVVGESNVSGAAGVWAKQTGASEMGFALRADSIRGAAGNFIKTLGAESIGVEAAVGISIATATDPAHCLVMGQAGTGDFMWCRTVAGDPTYRLTKDATQYILERGSDPTAYGGSGLWALYFKSDGAYTRAPDGTVSKLGAGGGIVTSDAGAVRMPDFLEELVTTDSGATAVSTTIAAPAGCYIERVLVRTVVAVPGGYHVGVTGAEKRWGDTVGGNVGDTNLTFARTPAPTPTGDDTVTVLLTHAGGTNFVNSLGQVRVTIFFVSFTAAAS